MIRDNSLSKTCVVDGILTSYSDDGTGRVLLFVHGWMDTKDTFAPLIRELTNQYRCVALDLPNFGQTENSEEIVTTMEYALFIQKFIKKLELKDYTYVGHSMGGQIGVLAVGKSILKPTKLMLVASAGIRDHLNILKLVTRQLSKVFKHIVPTRLKERFYKSIKSDYSLKLSPVHKKIISSVLTTDIQESAGSIQVPTLLIYGDRDIHTPLWMGERLHQLISGSKLAVVTGADHWVHKSSTQAVVAQIEDFLNA